MANKTRIQTRAILEPVTALLDFQYKWIPLHLVYTIAMLVSEEMRRWPYKARIKFGFAMGK